MVDTRLDADADTAPQSHAQGEPRQHIGRYEIRGTIGAGAMGVVLRGWDPQLCRAVAIKLLRRPSGPPEIVDEHRARLLREARALAALVHPNVVPVFDVGEHDGGLFVAMQFIEGPNMRQWLADERPGWRRVLGVFRAAGRGLAAAHTAGLVHRDFKPANVIVGDDGRVRVVDFGLARAFTDDDGAAPAIVADDPAATRDLADGVLGAVTARGILVGTPAYMAPELFEGVPASAATDQYAFCASLFEALYGRLPFIGDDVREQVAAKRAGRFVPAVKPPDVPDDLDAIVRRGLSPSASQRFADMPEVLRSLRGVSERAEAAARPLARARGPSRRVTAAVGLGVLALVALAVLSFGRCSATMGAPGPDVDSAGGME